MAGLIPLPPHHIHNTTRLTHREAHTFLSCFLERADIDAAYRPDSTLSERGPQALSTGSNPNLTLHHLKRILTGIEGKRVGGDLGRELGRTGEEADRLEDANGHKKQKLEKRTFNNEGAETEGTTPKKSKRKVYDAEELVDEENDDPALAVASESEDWQEKDAFELAQTDRHPGAELEQPTDETEEEELVRVEIEGTGEAVDPRHGQQESEPTPKGLSQKDKEERKRLKKLRDKENKAKRAEEKKTKRKNKE
ncbi:uncharacterized protein Z518_04567 [Rhinocladiella mackenziei CBS 650.93]|uniref:Uncharacterized protein n=1 Tax=Rhinocladiella mackenziei CBS 650.93 TaxID=1442369 RepID=A0A0D2ITV0_9EURO|nr:uncharacterized protein Z518_04567 [Rhinocladiella mackenziei CBS 650.93]KIX06591.1 hypothetical protein Z518_04567 [Rhinocladiella mackenziei CBS 650.93]